MAQGRSAKIIWMEWIRTSRLSINNSFSSRRSVAELEAEGAGLVIADFSDDRLLQLCS